MYKHILFLSAITLLICLPISLFAQTPRNLLTGKSSEAELAKVLVSATKWHPYPTISEPEKWQAIPEAMRADLIAKAEKSIGEKWPPLPATLFLEFVRNGNRSNYQHLGFSRRQTLATLVLAETLEDQGRFLDDIANGLWAICEESFWGVPAHVSAQKKGPGLPDVTEPIVDLFAAETASLMAWSLYLLEDKLDKVSPMIRERVMIETQRRILTPLFERTDFGWMGFDPARKLNNWTPWICSNWLATALILERDKARRPQTIHKILTCLDHFLNIYPADGGCDEGPTYWTRAGASLFDNLELLYAATNGAVSIFQEPLIKKMGQYICHAYISGEYFINFADASAKLTPPAELVYCYGNWVRDPAMMQFGAWLWQKRSPANQFQPPSFGSLSRPLADLFSITEIRVAKAAEPLEGEFWLPDVQVMGARSSSTSDKGFYLAAKGGHNAESHNHNDVGNFIVYYDGKPVLIDAGVGTYTRKTFSSERYQIWTMQSAYHNLPTINGVMQKDGKEFIARNVSFQASRARVDFSLDIAGAYPEEAKVGRWLRSISLVRGKRIELREQYSLSEFLEPVKLNLMTPLLVKVADLGKVVLSGIAADSTQSFVISYDANKFTADSEEIPLDDARLQSSWGDRLTRIVLTAKSRSLADGYRIVLASK